MTYPRPLTGIHQIELSSRCNLRCVYCPSPKLPREKLDMSMEHWALALSWVSHFVQQGTQGELALTGIGEALLHPQFVDCLAMARTIIGPERKLTFATNGILLTREVCQAIKKFDPIVFVSLHRPEKATLALHNAAEAGLRIGYNHAFATESFDWAGQVDWPVSIPKGKVMCKYLGMGLGVVLADGRITSCCLDASGCGQIGHVMDVPGTATIKPYELCGTCHMGVPA